MLGRLLEWPQLARPLLGPPILKALLALGGQLPSLLPYAPRVDYGAGSVLLAARSALLWAAELLGGLAPPSIIACRGVAFIDIAIMAAAS